MANAAFTLRKTGPFSHRFLVRKADLAVIADEVHGVIQKVAAGGPCPEEEFNALALRLAEAQLSHNPHLATFWKSAHNKPWNNWREIPPLPLEAFKHYEMTCLSPQARTNVFYSSGTTGQSRSRHWHCPDSLQLYRAAVKPWFAHHVLGNSVGPAPSARLFVSLTPPPDAAPHSSLVDMLDTVMKEWGLPESCFLGEVKQKGDWTLDLSKATGFLAGLAHAGQPVVLMGTAFNFVPWLDSLQERQMFIALPPGSRIMETGGYKGRSRAVPQTELHAALHQRLAVPYDGIIREYGMCELSSQAYDRIAFAPLTAPARFRFPPWVRVRILSPETGLDCPAGMPGLLCVYDLANVWSVMALQTADLAAHDETGFELLGRAAPAEPRGCSLMVTE